MAKQSTKTKAGEAEVTIDRRAESRRQDAEPVKTERRKKAARRRQIDPTTCERDYSEDEIEFMHALDEYKRRAGRMFPTCSEVLEVLRDIGYIRLTPEQKEYLDRFAIETVDCDAVGSEDEFDCDDASAETVILEDDLVAG